MPAAPDFPSASDLQTVKRALLSVSDKSGLVEMARRLQELGVELVSTGGSRATISEAGIPVRDISERRFAGCQGRSGPCQGHV